MAVIARDGRRVAFGGRRAADLFRTAEPEASRAGVVFDSADLPARHRYEAFRAFWGGLYDVRAPTEPAHDARALVKLWTLGEVTLGQLLLPQCNSFRSARQAKAFHGDVLVLRIPTQGTMRFVLDGEMALLRPGAAYLCNEMAPCACVHGEDFALSVLVVPFDAVGYDPYRHPRITTIPLDTAVGRVLIALVEAASREVASAGREGLCAPLMAFLRALLADLYQGGPDEPSVEAFRALAMRLYLEEHLFDETIDASTIARAVGTSRASVYRVFQGEGGVRRAVHRRRLRGALMDLVENEAVRGAIGQAAQRWGLIDASRFARMCRAEFGYPPGAVMEFLKTPPETVA
ncbi:helix-turn-helix domain-containing protein [Acuticoccus mangrovi]|uniref:Helix-turn-helix transcriptional regulator n=1 Tax=Acuticoccus mangrovi TaxID=2796142 RepID=A0A934IJ09_9HYPH|nr:AraC family transcriptional regulator [Acuticoccus mangrovi]MBJ3777363.1 helix-turn-helix transcriptional regulator [Acuticoccus mangrovi]